MTGPKVKGKAVSGGSRKEEPEAFFFEMRPFHSRDDLTSCWAGLVERPVMLLLKLRGRSEAPGGTGGRCCDVEVMKHDTYTDT